VDHKKRPKGLERRDRDGEQDKRSQQIVSSKTILTQGIKRLHSEERSKIQVRNTNSKHRFGRKRFLVLLLDAPTSGYHGYYKFVQEIRTVHCVSQETERDRIQPRQEINK
jgi:hypothetical protein